MFIFGHAGVTLGAALLADAALKEYSPEFMRQDAKLNPESEGQPSGQISILESLSGLMGDIRILFIGAFLPDIIDKPIGWLLYNYPVGNGRLAGQTLLFLLVIALFAYYLYVKRRRKWLLVLSFGTLCHLLLDEMWAFPQTFLWPLLGWDMFDKVRSDWWGTLLSGLLSHPVTLISEIVGLAVCIWLLYVLIRYRRLGVFLLKGRV